MALDLVNFLVNILENTLNLILRWRCYWNDVCYRHATKKTFYGSYMSGIYACDQCDNEKKKRHEDKIEALGRAAALARRGHGVYYCWLAWLAIFALVSAEIWLAARNLMR